jgi:hypothetical protein
MSLQQHAAGHKHNHPASQPASHPAHLEVEGQQAGVPVVCHKHEVVLSINSAPAGHHPRRFQRGLAQQRAAEEDLVAVAAVDGVCSTNGSDICC